MTKMRLIAIAAVAAAAAAMTAPAQAVTVAQFEGAPNSTFPNVAWTSSGTNGELTASGAGVNTADVQFSLQTVTGVTNVDAMLTLDAISTSAAQSAFGQLFQGGLGGSFEFKYNGTTPLVVDGHSYGFGADLLSGTFSGANISGSENGTAGAVFVATTASGQKLTLSSDILKFDSSQPESFSISLTSISPGLGATSGNALNSFTGFAGGSFEATLSSGGGQGGVPEPATWAMMILGVAGIGGALRRTRGLATA